MENKLYREYYFALMSQLRCHMLWCKFIMTISAHFNVLEAQMQRKYAEEHFHAFSAQNKLLFYLLCAMFVSLEQFKYDIFDQHNKIIFMQ